MVLFLLDRAFSTTFEGADDDEEGGEGDKGEEDDAEAAGGAAAVDDEEDADNEDDDDEDANDDGDDDGEGFFMATCTLACPPGRGDGDCCGGGVGDFSTGMGLFEFALHQGQPLFLSSQTTVLSNEPHKVVRREGETSFAS